MESKKEKNILTGQQIGLLGGPLYTVYKVLGASDYAEKVSGKAIFWMETNDADFNEINHIDFIDSKGDLRSLKWDIDTKGYSCGYIEVDDILLDIINEFFDSLIQTEFTDTLREIVLSCYRKGDTLAKSSRRLFEWLFKGTGVTVFDPSDVAFRKFSRKILLKEADETKDGKQCNLFILEGKKRMALFRKNGVFVLRDGSEVDLGNFDLLPNVKTRSICQDAWFNSDSYIAGPGEEKYLKELDMIYKRHKVAPAKVIPRMSIDLIEPRVKKVMSKVGVTIDDINEHSIEEMKKRALFRSSGFDKDATTDIVFKRLDDFINDLKKEGLKSENIKKDIRNVLKKMIGEKRREEKEKSEVMLNRIDSIYRFLRPFGKRQERVFNVFSFMNLYGGRSFVNFLFENYDRNNSTLEISNG